MANNEDTLGNNLTLNEGQFLRSKNGLFHALMQDDGNFVVYRGDLFKTKPSGYQKTALWGAWPADKPPPIGGGKTFHIHMQGDGNLCIYRQEPYGPVWVCPGTANNRANDGRVLVLHDNGRIGIDNIWDSDVSDSYGDVEFDKVEYDTDAAKITSLGPPKEAVSATAENDLNNQQTMHVTIAYTKTTTTSWTVSTTLTIGTKTEIECGIPGLAEGKVEVSAEFTQGFTWNKSNTETKQISDTVDIVVEPHKAVIAKITWSESSIDLPYRAVGKIKFNGYPEKLPVHLEGIYRGTACWDFHTVWKYVDPKNLKDLAPSAVLAALGNDGWTAIK